MAEASIPVAQDEFSCPVCLDLLKDSVTVPCGHSYCKSCITDCWDQEDQKRVYSCPQCRQTFSPRPALSTHVLLAEVVEKLKKTRLSADCDAGSGDVQCDVCTGKKLKAVKSCLVCVNSYCHNHLQQHESFFRGKKHKLTEATGRLQEMICTKHEEPLKLYCRTDQRCICYPCVMEEHKNHETVTAEAERTEKQRILKETQVKYQQRIQQREKDLQQLRETVESHKRSAQTAVEDSERIFTELIRSIERSRSELIRLIRDQEKTAVSRAEERLERLEQEINDLRRRDAELEQLSHTQDHIQFLQSFSISPESTEQLITICSQLSFSHVEKSVSKLKEKLEEFCKEEIEQISGRVTYSEIIPLKALKTRPEVLQHCRFLTLDPNTANKRLHLSEEDRAATYTDTDQPYPDHPDRFDSYSQVLCRESVCGRCYWELQWSGDEVEISVSYKSISRKGRSKESEFGCNDQSWSLSCTSSSYSFWHNNIKTDLPLESISRRAGEYDDDDDDDDDDVRRTEVYDDDDDDDDDADDDDDDVRRIEVYDDDDDDDVSRTGVSNDDDDDDDDVRRAEVYDDDDDDDDVSRTGVSNDDDDDDDDVRRAEVYDDDDDDVSRTGVSNDDDDDDVKRAEVYDDDDDVRRAEVYDDDDDDDDVSRTGVSNDDDDDDVKRAEVYDDDDDDDVRRAEVYDDDDDDDGVRRAEVYDDDDDDDVRKAEVYDDDDDGVRRIEVYDDDDDADDDDDDVKRAEVYDDDDDDDVRRAEVYDDDDDADDDDVRRIGVFVDHSAGTLSFFSVSDTMSLIHTVQTTFTQTLYPGFSVYSESSVKLCDPTAEIDT